MGTQIDGLDRAEAILAEAVDDPVSLMRLEHFPYNDRDAVLHLATGVAFLGLGLVQVRRDRAAL